MKILIIRTDIDETASSRALGGVDSAFGFEMYKKYVGDDKPCSFHICANTSWSKYTFLDEKAEYVGTFRTMDKLLERNTFLGNCLILTHEQWLDKQEPNWRTIPRYQYY